MSQASALIAASIVLSAPVAALDEDASTAFLDFPQAVQTASATEVDAFTWLVVQGDRTQVRFAKGPDFQARTLFATVDHDGQPVTDLVISPDGRFVVFATASALDEKQAYNPASLLEPPVPTLWVVSVEGDGAVRRVGAGIDPIFAPRGTRFLYRHGTDLRSVELGAAVLQDQSFAPGGASFKSIQWSADGSRIAFVQDRGGYSFLGLYRPGDDRVSWLVTGPDRVASPIWSPDGTQLAYLQFPGREHTKTYDFSESEPLAVKLVNVRTGQTQTLWQSKERASEEDLDDPNSALRWIGNDRLVFFSEHDGWRRLYAITVAGGEPVAFTPASCEVAESEQIGPTELLVIHNCVDLHTRQASIFDVRTGAQRPIASADVVMANASASGRRFLAFTGGDTNIAPLLRIVDLRTRKVFFQEKPSAYGYRASFTTPAPQVVTFQAEDGLTVPAQLFPSRAKGRRPAVIFVHGGPHRQMFPAYHFINYYARTYAINRRLAELGYVVLSVNFRAGVGYGRAFREAEGRVWRSASEYQDVLAAARWLTARPEVDARRLGIWGGSYGGLLTGQALARNSDLFAAGVAVHGVFDWSWPSPKSSHLNPSRVFGVSDADRARAFQSSPLAAVDRWNSPVLLFTGDADMNVDVLETVDLAQKLTTRGVHVETVLVPGEAHGFVRHATWTQLWQRMSQFLNQQLARESNRK